MKKYRLYPVLVAMLLAFFSTAPGCAEKKGMPAAIEKAGPIKVYSYAKGGYVMSEKIVKNEAEWKKQLTPEQFRILRDKGTEVAGTGKYARHHEHGVYVCAGCGLDLFRSEDKYESGTGWPSYFAPADLENITTESDNSLFSRRTEVLCRRCNGHLGHVFEDGPKPTGLRYCINSGSMEFVAAKK